MSTLGAADAVPVVDFATDGDRLDVTIGGFINPYPFTRPTNRLYVTDGTGPGTALASAALPAGSLAVAAGRLFLDATAYTESFHASTCQIAPGQLFAYAISSKVSATPAAPLVAPIDNPITATLVGDTLPTTIAAGSALGGTLTVQLTAAATVRNGGVLLQSFLSGFTLGSTAGGAVGFPDVRRHLRIAAGHSIEARIRVHVRAGRLLDASYLPVIEIYPSVDLEIPQLNGTTIAVTGGT